MSSSIRTPTSRQQNDYHSSRRLSAGEQSTASFFQRSVNRLSVAPITPFAIDAASHSDVTRKRKGLSLFLCFCLVLNFISFGYLFLPWAFAQAGLVLSTVALIIVFGQSLITCVYVMEACARAEVVVSIDNNVLADLNLSSSLHSIKKNKKDEQSSNKTNTVEEVVIEPTENTDLAQQVQETHPSTVDIEQDTEPTSKSTDTASSRMVYSSNDQPPLSAPVQDMEASMDSIKECHLDEEENLETKQYKSQTETSQKEPSEDAAVDNAERHIKRRSLPSMIETGLHHDMQVSELLTMNSIRALKKSNNTASSEFVIQNRKYELPQLCRMFLGRRWAVLFTITTACDLYGISWATAAVFTTALSDMWPIASHDEILYIAIFAAVVIPLACLPYLVNQLQVQVLFLGLRMLMVLAMAITVIAACVSDVAHFENEQEPGAVSGDEVELFNFSELHTMLQIGIFSTAVQFSVPIIAGESKDRKRVFNIYAGSTIFLSITNLALSLLLARFFGEDVVEESSNLNWSGYHGGTATNADDAAVWAKVVSHYIVLFPAFDGIAIFSLLAVSLGEILMGAWYREKVHQYDGATKERFMFRLIGALPQLVGAAFIQDLSAIANYAALFTVASYTICPCLLAVSSRKMMHVLGLSQTTAYSTMFSSDAWAYVIGCSAVALIIYVIIASSLG